jgi:O-antigen ligase
MRDKRIYLARQIFFLLDKIFLFVLLLNLTGLFPFVAALIGFESLTISIIMFAINCIYIVVRYKAAKQIFCKQHVIYWFVFLVLWPLLATLYSPKINVREVALQIYYFTLLLGVIIYISRRGFLSFHYVLTIAFVVTIFGLILSMITDSVFQPVALMTDHDLEYQGRAYGFFIQPNVAAMNFLLLFIAWFAGINTPKLSKVFLSTYLLFMLIGITGSRGGYIVTLAVLVLIFIHNSVKLRKPFSLLMNLKNIVIFLLLIFFSQFSISLLPNLQVMLSSGSKDNYNLAARTKAISEMKFIEKDVKGKSTVADRGRIFLYYYDLVCKHPVLGYGFGSNTYYLKEGSLQRSSHNQYLKIAYETGIFRMLFYLAILLFIYLDSKRKRIQQLFHTNSYIQFLVVVMLAGLVSNTVLDSRVFYCVLGVFIAIIIDHHKFMTDDIQTEIQNQSQVIIA